MILYYIRHGDPIYDPDGLTEKGMMQADALVSRLSGIGIKRIFSSSSNRAYVTAKPTSEALGIEIEVLDWLRESYAWRDLTVRDADGRRRWSWDYPSVREFFMSQEIRALDKSWYDHPYFENTSFKEGFLRIENESHAFLKDLGYSFDESRNGYIPVAPNDDKIAIFAHQGVGLAFMSAILGIPYPMFASLFDTSHTGMTVIDFRCNSDIVFPRVLQLSNDSHLFSAGLDTKYNGWIDI